MNEDEQDQDGPSITFALEEDPYQNSQLSGFGRDKSPVKDVKYRASEQQLLKEGKLGSSEFTARLRQASFGTFKGQAACLVVVKVDFAAKNRGWFRFRSATVEMEVSEADDDGDDDEEYAGPLVCTFYPELIRGHIQTAAETYGIKFEVPVPTPVPSGGLSAHWDIHTPHEGQHLIHGSLGGNPHNRVKWQLHENEVSKSGLYEQPVFAFVVRCREERGFLLGMTIRATTYGGFGIVGKGGARIMFTKAGLGGGDKGEGRLNGLTGGSATVGGKTWSNDVPTDHGPVNLQEVDLENLTQMRAALLGPQGPGGGQFTLSGLQS